MASLCSAALCSTVLHSAAQCRAVLQYCTTIVQCRTGQGDALQGGAVETLILVWCNSVLNTELTRILKST